MELRINELTKQYGEKTALDHFSVTLDEGVWGLLGPNGAGKTTLMNIVAGVLRQTSGSVYWDGKNIDELGAEYRDILGFLPQNPGLYKNFSARKFLEYMAALKGVYQGKGEKKALRARIDELLELVNLSADAHRKVGGFSGGMKRRLGIAQVLLNDPKLIILDEPTAGLDPQERIRFRNLISTVAFDRIVIWSTHIVSDIEYISKEVLLIKQGKFVAAAPSAKLLEEIDGMVWTVLVSQKETEQYLDKYKVGNIVKREEGIELRIVSREKPAEHAQPAKAGLEDLYLYHFNEGAEQE